MDEIRKYSLLQDGEECESYQSEYEEEIVQFDYRDYSVPVDNPNDSEQDHKEQHDESCDRHISPMICACIGHKWRVHACTRRRRHVVANRTPPETSKVLRKGEIPMSIRRAT